MTFGPTIEAMFAAATKRLHKMIERQCEYAKGGRSRATVNRSVGQKYRRREK